MPRVRNADWGMRIGDLKARYWILATDLSEFGGSFFSHHKGTKTQRLNKQKNITSFFKLAQLSSCQYYRY